MTDKAVVRQPGEGKALWVLGGLYEVKAASDETHHQLTIMEMTIPKGMGPPAHTHHGGEAVYVLEGRIRYHIGEEMKEAGPGAFFYIPEGTWENCDPQETSRVLVIYSPGGEDKFFEEIGEPATRREIPPAPTSIDFERISAAAARHGMQIRPPANM
jgi:quercetin dioxygenase-like cupin family protein